MLRATRLLVIVIVRVQTTKPLLLAATNSNFSAQARHRSRKVPFRASSLPLRRCLTFSNRNRVSSRKPRSSPSASPPQLRGRPRCWFSESDLLSPLINFSVWRTTALLDKAGGGEEFHVWKATYFHGTVTGDLRRPRERPGLAYAPHAGNAGNGSWGRAAH